MQQWAARAPLLPWPCPHPRSALARLPRVSQRRRRNLLCVSPMRKHSQTSCPCFSQTTAQMTRSCCRPLACACNAPRSARPPASQPTQVTRRLPSLPRADAQQAVLTGTQLAKSPPRRARYLRRLLAAVAKQKALLQPKTGLQRPLLCHRRRRTLLRTGHGAEVAQLVPRRKRLLPSRRGQQQHSARHPLQQQYLLQQRRILAPRRAAPRLQWLRRLHAPQPQHLRMPRRRRQPHQAAAWLMRPLRRWSPGARPSRPCLRLSLVSNGHPTGKRAASVSRGVARAEAPWTAKIATAALWSADDLTPVRLTPARPMAASSTPARPKAARTTRARSALARHPSSSVRTERRPPTAARRRAVGRHASLPRHWLMPAGRPRPRRQQPFLQRSQHGHVMLHQKAK